MKKAFRPLGGGFVQKQWLDDGDELPDGWFASVAEANAVAAPARQTEEPAPVAPVTVHAPAPQPARRGPGRPRTRMKVPAG